VAAAGRTAQSATGSVKQISWAPVSCSADGAQHFV